MEEEEREDEDIIEEEKKEDLEETAKFGDAGVAGIFSDLLLEENEKGDKEEMQLLGYKRKEKKLKKMPLQLNKKKTRKREPTTFQRIFDVMIKADVISEATVKDAAAKFKYEIEPDGINYFMELGRARASLKKFGLPSDICKNPFHLYTFSNFKENTSVITDDKVVWEAIYSQAYGPETELNKYVAMLTNSVISTFSIITEKVFACKKAYSGYVQDFYRRTAIINSVPLDGESTASLRRAFDDNAEGTYKKECTFTDGTKYNYYQYENVILCGENDVSLQTLLQNGLRIKCFNSKNKLSMGMKEIKTQDKIGTYINIHEIKPVDFSPSCLFTDPVIPGVKYFVDAKIDTNALYNQLAKVIGKVNNLITLPVPDNIVFWDNISSLIQLIGLMALTNDLTELFKTQITSVIELYYKYKDVINSWKRVYKQFESIVIGFYDTVTTRLSIDGITRLEKKTIPFISDYLYLRNHSSYADVRTFFGNLPKIRLINNFVTSSGPYEIVSSISKLITILRSGKNIKEAKIDELFRTIGLMCTRVLYGGDYPMIPKVRSKAAFLGGPGKELSNDTLKKNISYLLEKFKSDLKKEFEAKRKPLEFKQIEQLIDRMMENSAKRLNDAIISNNLVELKKQIKSDERLYDSLREDVEEMYENGEEISDMLSYADFLDNPYFNSFIVAFKKLDNILKENVTKTDTSKIISALKLNPKANVKRMKLKKIAKVLKMGAPDDMPVAPVVLLDKDKLVEAGNNLTFKEGKNMEGFKVALADTKNVIEGLG